MVIPEMEAQKAGTFHGNVLGCCSMWVEERIWSRTKKSARTAKGRFGLTCTRHSKTAAMVPSLDDRPEDLGAEGANLSDTGSRANKQSLEEASAFSLWNAA